MDRRRILAWSIVVGACAAPFLAASCGSSGKVGAGGGSTGGASTGGASTGSSSSGVTLGDASMGCSTGQSCGDGGVCAGSTCCSADLACGEVCCAASQVCSFQQCVTPGAQCTDSSDCNPGEYCESALGTDAGALDAGCVGAMLTTGRCLPVPPTCPADAGVPDSGTIACLESCTFHPTGTLNPVLKYSWGGVIKAPFNTDVMMAPIVLPLEDTNCDGKIDGRDVPSIVFTSFTGGDYQGNGTLHAIRVVNGALADRWAATAVVNPSQHVAGGNIDGKAGNEIVACGVPANGAVSVMAFNGSDGSLLWSTSLPGTGTFPGYGVALPCFMPAIADLDGDGKIEVIVEGAVLDGATGTVKATLPGQTFVVSDIDGNGTLDIVTGNAAYHSDGTMFASAPGISGLWPAIGDLDLDGVPEVVSVDWSTHSVSIWHYDATAATKATVIRSGVDINGTAPQHCPAGSAGYTEGGGPATVADCNGDGYPDVALAGGIGYTVVDGKKLMDSSVANAATVSWTSVTTDCSSACTGSSVFDFDGKGIAPGGLLQQGLPPHLQRHRRRRGLADVQHDRRPWRSCPVIADVDNDGHANIVVVSNAYAAAAAPGSEIHCSDDPTDAGAPYAQAGIRVFGDANGTWVRTRAIWNQHSYHVTNVNDDGTIPQNELANWLQPGLNNFRQNKSPGLEFAAAALAVTVGPTCPGPTALVAVVRNLGQAAVPAGVVVGFYEGTPPGTKLGQALTTQDPVPAGVAGGDLPARQPRHGAGERDDPRLCANRRRNRPSVHDRRQHLGAGLGEVRLGAVRRASAALILRTGPSAARFVIRAPGCASSTSAG